MDDRTIAITAMKSKRRLGMPADEAAPAAEASTDVIEERAARIRDLVKATMILRHTRASDLDLLRREKSGDQDTIVSGMRQNNRHDCEHNVNGGIMVTNNAIQFWEDLKLFQRAFHKSVPMFIRTDKGAHEDVWPSFFDNQLRNNSREIRRKRVQIAWPNLSNHVSMFIKNVAYESFISPARELLDRDMRIGDPGADWQSIQIITPQIDVHSSVQEQADKLDKIFHAAERLYDFFLLHEKALLAMPRQK